MSTIILFISIVILSCIVTNKFSKKLGMPTLVFFMFLGMLFGSDGILKIAFEDYDLTSKLCSVGLLFIKQILLNDTIVFCELSND